MHVRFLGGSGGRWTDGRTATPAPPLAGRFPSSAARRRLACLPGWSAPLARHFSHSPNFNLDSRTKIILFWRLNRSRGSTVSGRVALTCCYCLATKCKIERTWHDFASLHRSAIFAIEPAEMWQGAPLSLVWSTCAVHCSSLSPAVCLRAQSTGKTGRRRRSRRVGA